MKEKKKDITLQYKCNRCGVTYGNVKGSGTDTENVFTMMMLMKTGCTSHLPSKYYDSDIHSCKDGGSGVAQFVGMSYDNKPLKLPKVYTVDFMTTENWKKFNEFCVKVNADKRVKHLLTGHLALLWHFATGLGVYKK